jgi:hypothetical protein
MKTKLQVFRVTQFDAKTLSWWRTRRAKIDMEPSYQRRGGLWSPADKSYLIDSILNGFDIPKLYVADFTWGDSPLNKKRLPYAIIDGKQRLEAIFDFYDGTVVLNDDFIYRENPTLNLSGLSYQDLLGSYAEIAEVFDNYNLSVMSVSASSEEPINELFIRLNRSKPLTGAEIRNAMAGPAPKVIRKLSQHEFFVENIAFGVKRGQDQNAAAKLLMFEYHDKPMETKKRNLDEFVKQVSLLKGANRKLELAGRHVVDNLDVMTSIFLPKDRLLNSPGVLPVYYWFIRSQPEKRHHHVREFIKNFEEKRRANRQKLQEHPKSSRIDPQLVEFDNYNRSTNDQLSHDGRVKILESRFAKHVVET